MLHVFTSPSTGRLVLNPLRHATSEDINARIQYLIRHGRDEEAEELMERFSLRRAS